MTLPEVKKQQIGLLLDGESNENVQKNVIKYVFREFIGMATIDRTVELCMELYHIIMVEFNQPQGEPPTQ